MRFYAPFIRIEQGRAVLELWIVFDEKRSQIASFWSAVLAVVSCAYLRRF